MTRQEEWETQKTDNAETLAAAPLSRITGRHKLNTRNRGEYEGYTKSAVLKLIQKSQNAQKKKRHFTCSPSEKDALLAYYDERLASLGASASRGTPDWLKFDSVPLKTTPVDPHIQCGSVECQRAHWFPFDERSKW